MDDLDKYIQNRKERDPKFAEGYDSGYQEFLIGILLREARKGAGVTQDELAAAIHTKKSVISRLENQASDAKISTLRKVAQALGKELVIELREPEAQPKRRQAARKQLAAT
ncbi:MAG: helix-turn-helix domain-containing protein [Opitutales bacterium]